jgi:hypothetical protein
MKVQQQFDEGMTTRQKIDHVQEWLKDLEGKGFELQLCLLKINDKNQIEEIDSNKGAGDAYEEAIGYKITATSKQS